MKTGMLPNKSMASPAVDVAGGEVKRIELPPKPEPSPAQAAGEVKLNELRQRVAVLEAEQKVAEEPEDLLAAARALLEGRTLPPSNRRTAAVIARELKVLQHAIGLQQELVTKARQDAATKVCESLAPQFCRHVAAAADHLLSAWAELAAAGEISSWVESAGYVRSGVVGAGVMMPGLELRAGDSMLSYWLREAIAAGALSRTHQLVRRYAELNQVTDLLR